MVWHTELIPEPSFHRIKLFFVTAICKDFEIVMCSLEDLLQVVELICSLPLG